VLKSSIFGVKTSPSMENAEQNAAFKHEFLRPKIGSFRTFRSKFG